MAVTVTAGPDRRVEGNKRIVTGTLNVGTYATSGVATTAADFGMSTLDGILFMQDGKVRTYMYDKTAGKILAITIVNGAEVANSTDLSADRPPFIAIGT